MYFITFLFVERFHGCAKMHPSKNWENPKNTILYKFIIKIAISKK